MNPEGDFKTKKKHDKNFSHNFLCNFSKKINSQSGSNFKHKSSLVNSLKKLLRVRQITNHWVLKDIYSETVIRLILSSLSKLIRP